MASTEFSLIQRYFSQFYLARPDIVLGIGDDSAVVKPPNGIELAISTDTLIEDVHFFKQTDPFAIGYKALAVNLSDLAAMGAKPAWFSLALSMPEIDEAWLADFSQGLLSLAQKYQLALIGGDTTQGALSITIHICGFLPTQAALYRSSAKPDDGIYLTGCLGDAALTLKCLKQQYQLEQTALAAVSPQFYYPKPRVEQGEELRKLGANAAIDISDGLAADLGHILTASKVGACLWLDTIPVSATVKQYLANGGDKWLPLVGGDDYELCFTLPAEKQATLLQLTQQWDCACTQIGVIETQPGLRILQNDQIHSLDESLGYQHFA